jgi:hypothetical protein
MSGAIFMISGLGSFFCTRGLQQLWRKVAVGIH